MDVKGKIAVITGGSNGIGYSLSRVLRDKGSDVYSIDIKEVGFPLDGVSYLHADVRDPEQLSYALNYVQSPVDIAVNNAGVMRRGKIFDTSAEDFDLLFDTNIRGYWMLLKYLNRKMAEDATVVQISSSHALHPREDPAVYTLTKQAVVHLSDMLQRAFPEYRVKTAFPGPVRTALLIHGRTDEDARRIVNISHHPDYVASLIAELIETDKTRLLFDASLRDYRFE